MWKALTCLLGTLLLTFSGEYAHAATRTVAATLGRTEIYVDTIRVLREDGPVRPEFTRILRRMLHERGYSIVEPALGQNGGEVRPNVLGEKTLLLTRVVLLESRLNLGVGVAPSAQMKINASLMRPGSPEVSLGPFNVHIQFEDADVRGNDLTRTGSRKAFRELFLPVVDAVERATR
jgi:hypothetical protein